MAETIIQLGDCLELMKGLPDKSIDLFICDLPYGETNCKWDTIIDMEEFWKEFKRLRKSKKVACIHFCSTKFGYTLIKSWEKGFKMDMVWKKRNKTGGIQSRYRPMRNHEMVYFFYDEAPKYNRDKYHKRIKNYAVKKENGKDAFGNDNIGVSVKESGFGLNFDPPNPTSVVEENSLYKTSKYTEPVKKGFGYEVGSGIQKDKKGKDRFPTSFDPPNPASVLEEETDVYGETKEQRKLRNKKFCFSFDPPNPSSVVEEETIYGISKEKVESNIDKIGVNYYDPPNPASVLEQDPNVNEDGKSAHGWDIEYMNKPRVAHFEPVLPTSMFESTKVFIGKRHHQTEKPLDILEFFLKYYSDEGDCILDPTMGSGSTGVACKNLKRKFIGFEKDEKIFEVAKKRILE